MSGPPVRTARDGRLGRITLDRPQALHALDQTMCELMTEALLAWRHDRSIELVLVEHAEGTRGFCAGGDIRMLAESGKGDGHAADAFFRAEYRLNALIHGYPKPYIAVQDGVTMGGGVGISVHGSHRVATERTVFAMPEAGIGLFPDVGGGWFLPRLEGELGLYLALTAARLKGREVLQAGIATHYTAAEDLPALKVALAEHGTAALDPLERANPGPVHPHAADIDRLFAGATVADIVAALEADGSDFAKATLAAFEGKAPKTMVVSLRQLRTGRTLARFADVMRMEYRIARRMVRAPDFQEGVRAVIIEKDNKPAFEPCDLGSNDAAWIEAIFAPHPDGELDLIGEE